MKSWERWIVYILLFIVLILSIISICRTCPRTDLGFDYMGVIIGLLSLLVTFLLGWNIYQVLNIKQTKEQIQKEVDEKIRRVLASLHYNSFLAFKDKSSVGAVTSLVLCLNQLIKNVDDETENIERIVLEIEYSFAKLKEEDEFGENNRGILCKVIREIEKNNDYKNEILNAVLLKIKARLDKEKLMEGRKS